MMAEAAFPSTPASDVSKRVCVVTGAGPGTGTALARRFADGGYHVALIARDAERLGGLQDQIANSRAYPCDVTDPEALKAASERIISEMGVPSIVVHNAVGGAFGTFMEIEPQVLDRNFQVNVMGLLHLVRQFAPGMVELGRGAIVVTGNTSALRGSAKFAGFAPTKAAQRILAESMARDLGPKGVHVAYLVIDAVIDLPWTQAAFNADGTKPDGFFIQPSAIADEVWHVAHQPRGAWSFNVEVRPFGEIW